MSDKKTFEHRSRLDLNPPHAQIRTERFEDRFGLESGQFLPELEVAYSTYGELNAARDNVIWVCHALTANSDVSDWWHGFFGPGNVLDPQKYFIICANILGSCYGTTGPDSIHPHLNERYGKDFPLITIRDMIQAHRKLAVKLDIRGIELILGGSMGGQQALEWAISEPGFINRLFVIASNTRHSPWGIALNEAQRMAITSDPTYLENHPEAGAKGLAAARSIGMISYRNYHTFAATQQDDDHTLQNHRAATYQRYQGKKLSSRFTPLSYLSLSKSMDTHHIGRERGGIEVALARITAKTLVVGIETDILFPIEEQKLIADGIKSSDLVIIPSLYGHDGFLLEYNQLNPMVKNLLK